MITMSYFTIFAAFLICIILTVVSGNREMIICETTWKISPQDCCPLPKPNLSKDQQKVFQKSLEEFHTLKNGCKPWLPYFRDSLKVYRKNGDVSLTAIKTIFGAKATEKLWNKTVDKSIKTCMKKSEWDYFIIRKIDNLWISKVHSTWKFTGNKTSISLMFNILFQFKFPIQSPSLKHQLV